MPLEMILNERSLDHPAPSIAEARERMLSFLETARQATKRRVSRAIRTDRDLNDLLLGVAYPVRKWQNDPEVDIEAKRFFRSLVSKAPYFTELPQLRDQAFTMECRHHDTEAQGLLAAYLIDGLALSLRSSVDWYTPHLKITLRQLHADGDIVEIEEHITHASEPAHIATHHHWIAQRTSLPEPRDGATLWMQRTERYQHLIFCANVEAHLARYHAGDKALIQIMRRFAELDRYAQSWNQGRFDPDQLAGKTTLESSETLQRYAPERTFRCPDGQERLFSWHMRFTPGAGRLYFFPDELTHTLIIGYVGDHLPTVLYP